MERPTRAYSIGSRSEHNRLLMQHMGGGLNSGSSGGSSGSGAGVSITETEHPNVRVRAFSVGSRAKIPRCDLQRGVLKPKLLLEHQQLQKELKDKHCHSNSSSNFNINADMGLLSSSISSSTANAYNLRQLCTHRDKKSTSAPLLLIHKSQNSVDRMSDLMEIDFSIKQQQKKQKNSNSTNSRINLITSTSTSSTTNMPTTIQPTITTTTTTTTALLNKTYNCKSVPPTNTITIAATTQDMSLFTTTNATMAATNSSSKYNLSSNNSIKKYNNKATNVSKQHQQQPQKQQITATDNGYLEMKPVGASQPIATTNIKQQQQLRKQRSEQLHVNQTPKTTITAERNEQNEGYDVPPEKSNKHQQQQILMRNINANFTPSLIAVSTIASTTMPMTSTTISSITTITNTTVLTNKNQQEDIKTINADNDNNHNNLEIISLNDENNVKQPIQHKLLTTTTALMSTPERNYDLILDLEQEKQKKQECQINKNIVNIDDDYANMERKFDAYMKLGVENPNANNNSVDKFKTTTTTTSSTETLKFYDNEKHVLTHSLSHDEKRNNAMLVHQQQYQQQKMNRKSCGSTSLQPTTNLIDTSGYELLQIKNDKSLINQRIFTSAGNLNPVINKDNNNKILTAQTTTATTTTAISNTRPRSTNSTLLHSLSSSNNSSNISLSQPVTPTTTTTTTTATTTIKTITPTISTSTSSSILTNSVINALNSKTTPPPPPQPATSRPSSLNLDPHHELYYASLDWPQCSQEIQNTAIENNIISTGSGGVVVTNETVVLPSCTSVHNVYAKIDFDHSDSSSSSSKNI